MWCNRKKDVYNALVYEALSGEGLQFSIIFTRSMGGKSSSMRAVKAHRGVDLKGSPPCCLLS